MMRFCLALALAACGHAASHDQAPAARADDDRSCPVLVPGTSVTVEDTDKGAALVFVTTGDVPQVRTRAKFLATAHGKHQRPAQMPSDGDVAALQSELRMHATHLASGSCKMAM